MPDIGYYTLPVIASFAGIDAQVNKGMSKSLGRFGDFGKKSGQAFGKDLNAEIAAATKKTEELIRKSGTNIAKLGDKEANAADKTRLALQKLNEVRNKGYTDSRLTSARNNFAKAQRDEAAAVRATQSETNKLKNAQKDLANVRKRVTDEFNKPLQSPSGKGFLSGISSEMGGITGKFSSFGGGAGKGFVAGAAAAILAGGLVAVGAKAAGLVAAGFESIIATGLDFSKTMNNFQGVTRASAEEMRKMQTTARALGSDTTLAGASASDAALAMTELAKAGFSVDESMTAARGTLELATAGQIDAAKAAEIQSNAMNAFGLKADSAAHTADVLANAAIASSADIPDLGLALQQVGGIAKGFGENLDDTVATLAIFANAGVKGSDAGTLLKTTMQSITDQGNPAQGAIKALNLQLYDMDSHQFVGFRELFRQLDVAKKALSPEDFQAETNILFGSDAMRSAMLGNAEAFDAMREKLERVGAAGEMAAAQMQGLPGAVESFKNTAESIKLDAFDALGPALTTTLNGFVDFLSTHKSDVMGFFNTVADAAFSMGKVVTAAFYGLASSGAAVAHAFGADGVGDSLDFAAKASEDAFNAIEDGQAVLHRYTARAGEAAKLTDALGDSAKSLKTVGDDVTIDIKDNTPDVEAKLAALHLHLEAMATDPTKLKIVSDTAEAEGPVNAFRQQQQGTPIDIPFSVHYEQGSSFLPEWFKYIGGAAGPATLPVQVIGGPPGGVTNPAGQTGGPSYNPLLPAGPPVQYGGRAAGGSIFGPGTGTSDSVPIMASAGEHMWTAAEVNAVGGQANMYRLRALARKGALSGFAGGGDVFKQGLIVRNPRDDRWGWAKPGDKGGGKPVWSDKPGPGITGGPSWGIGGSEGRDDIHFPWEPFTPLDPYRRNRRGVYGLGSMAGFKEGGAIDPVSNLYQVASSMVGTPYSQAAWNDCSGSASQLVNALLGLPPKASRMSTATAAAWLSQKGAVLGAGPSGTLRIGWKNGGPGGGHMAVTLPDGRNAEAGGAHGSFLIGADAKGADDPSFTDHAFIPVEAVYPDGAPAGGGADALSYGSGGAATSYGGSGGSFTPPTEKQVREADEKVADADERVRRAEQKQKELKADAKQSEKDNAQAELDKAKREAADARADAEKVKKGTFKPGSGGGKGGGGGGGGSPGSLGDIAKMGIDGLLETIGADGSFLPENLGIPKTLMAALGLKFNTPAGSFSLAGGWQPRQGESGIGGDPTGGGGTSLSPFGMQTTMPQVGSPASGVGAGPAPGPVDQSTNININNPQGDPAEIEKRTRTALLQTPRLDSHMPAGF